MTYQQIFIVVLLVFVGCIIYFRNQIYTRLIALTITDQWLFETIVDGILIGIVIAFCSVIFSGVFEQKFNELGVWLLKIDVKFVEIHIDEINQLEQNQNKKKNKIIDCEFNRQRARNCKDEQGNPVSLKSITVTQDTSLSIEIVVWDKNEIIYAGDDEIECSWFNKKKQSCKLNYAAKSDKKIDISVSRKTETWLTPFSEWLQLPSFRLNPYIEMELQVGDKK